MASGNATDQAYSQEPVFGDVQHNWGWVLALGIISLILGIIGIGMSVGLTIAGVMMFGILILVAGGIQILDAFKCKGWKGVVWHLIMAILYLFAGVTVISAPLLASMILTLVLAGVLILSGIVRVIMAFQLRGFTNWIIPLIGGIISIILGAIIVAGWPISGLWVIGLFIAIELIVNGWSYIFIALAARQAGKTAPVRSATTA